jgi:hypothetical protein
VYPSARQALLANHVYHVPLGSVAPHRFLGTGGYAWTRVDCVPGLGSIVVIEVAWDLAYAAACLCPTSYNHHPVHRELVTHVYTSWVVCGCPRVIYLGYSLLYLISLSTS